ncbi:MAG: hypothetical protein AAB225_18310 [Acidobacteriota bacterium]
MAAQTSTGQCEFCGATFAANVMTRHLTACGKAAAQGKKTSSCFHLVVEGRYASAYWLHLAASPRATLSQLDQFLRGIWLECCGHLSAFTIGGIRYAIQPLKPGDFPFGGTPERGMAVPLARVLQPRVKFGYEYDYGSTTDLTLRVVGMPEWPAAGPAIRVVARNHQPEVKCAQCGSAPARTICTECAWSDKGWLCEACAAAHECDEDMFLPVVNSPRVGVCGYTG